MKFNITHKWITYLFLMAGLLLPYATSQADDSEITEGTEYWLTIPYAKMKQLETARGDFPIALWIGSKTDTDGEVFIVQDNRTVPFTVEANKITQIPLDDYLMCKEGGKVLNKGIHVKSQEPISVVAYLSYEWTGEAFRCIPVEWLGKEYVTTNLYQDSTDENKPAQIAVVATEDGTIVEFTPTAPTQTAEVGVKSSFSLKKGQVFLILGKDLPMGYTQDWKSDITGTYIKANKPIAVISGHTKGCFPRLFLGSRSGYTDPVAHFSRNMLSEMLWPIELLGSEYVMAPLKYTDRPYNESTIIPDSKGDLVRMIAAYDGTTIYRTREDGTLMALGRQLDRGEYHQIINSETAGLFTSNKPFLCAQYGKTWWLDDGMMGPVIEDQKGKDNKTLNPHRSGQGMLIILAPIPNWTTNANFRSPRNVDNLIYITFKTTDYPNLYINDEPLSAIFGNAIKPIFGTEYAYLTEPIEAGDHFMEGRDGAKFAAYAYGNWDNTKDGFAYGYPVGINYARPCNDSLWVEDDGDCGIWDGAAHAVDLQADTSCAGIFSIIFRYSQSENVIWTPDEDFKRGDKDFTFHIEAEDPSKRAVAVVTFMTYSGFQVEREYIYEPELIEADPSYINFGLLKVGDVAEETFVIRNPGTVPVTVYDLFLKKGEKEYFLNVTNVAFPLTLEPLAEQEIVVQAAPDEEIESSVIDYVVAKLTCYDREIDTLRVGAGNPVVWIGDAHWDPLPISSAPQPKDVLIENRSNVPVEIYGLTWDDKDHFPQTSLDNYSWPLIIQPDDTYTFKTFYTPNGDPDVHQTTAYFDANTTEIKLYSDWDGSGINAAPLITGYDWTLVRVIDNFSINELGVSEYSGVVKLNATGNSDQNVVSVVIDPGFETTFRLDDAAIPETLSPDNIVSIDAWFAPKTEGPFEANVTLNTEFAGNVMSVSGVLKGIANQPHIKVNDRDWPNALLLGEFEERNVLIEHVTNIEPRQLYISDLTLRGANAAYFEIDQQWMNDNIPGYIQIDGSWEVPVTYRPGTYGDHTAEIVATCDAPVDEGSEFDDNVGLLTARAFQTELASTDHDFLRVYITLEKDGQVSFTNLSSIDVTMTNTLEITGTDAMYFDINTWYIMDGANRIDEPTDITLAPNAVLYVDVKFMPTENRLYHAEIEYVTEYGTEISNLDGEGIIHQMYVRIPKGKYVVEQPGERFDCEVLIERHPDEIKTLAEADINGFIARIFFEDKQGQAVVSKNLFPDVVNCNDLKLGGTMTQNNWNCEYANIVDDEYLEVKMTSDQALSPADGTLLKFGMRTFLTDLSYVELPIEFTALNENGEELGYLFIEEFPGDVRINPVCVDTLRLVIPSDQSFSLMQNTPNPVTNKTVIEYSVGLEAQTTITLYNNNSDEVAVLVNQVQQPGVYQITLDVIGLNLSSGVYHYRIESGPFEQTKSFVITK